MNRSVDSDRSDSAISILFKSNNWVAIDNTWQFKIALIAWFPRTLLKRKLIPLLYSPGYMTLMEINPEWRINSAANKV